MSNLLLSIAAGVVVFFLALATRVVHPGLCGLFGLAGAIGAYILLARRSGKQLEAVMARELDAAPSPRAPAAGSTPERLFGGPGAYLPPETDKPPASSA